MEFDIQAILEAEKLILHPLQEKDFSDLYRVASDPKIWEQHPSKNRWKEEVFKNFFDEAIKSKGAFKIVDKATDKLIGTTRIYDYSNQESSICIGYTFYSTAYWGTGINQIVKKIMLDYLFQFIEKVYFCIDSKNVRSQISITRLGAKKFKEKVMHYTGEPTNLDFFYAILKKDWLDQWGNSSNKKV